VDDWFKYIPKENNLPYKLLDLGFDVWIGNNRGVYDYSANISYLANQIDIYWNFDFTDMADHDLPAQIDYILSATGESKLTYIGYGRGNTQMFYGMAKDPDYFAKRVEQFVALSPALYYSSIMNVFDYNYYFAGIDAAGIYVIGGPTWTEDRKRLCGRNLCLNAVYPCDYPLEVPACNEYPESGVPGQPLAIKDFKHFQQNTINEAFNEYVPSWEDRNYAKLVPLDKVPRVPIHLITANSDLIWADCSEELMRRISSIQSLSQFDGFGRFHNSSEYFSTIE
jgi:pimeloyl-ACP methyl ester carboxylesterase